MKTIQVLNHFPPHQIAGTEVYVWALTDYLNHNGYDMAVLLPNYHKHETETYKFQGIKVHKYSEPSVVDRQLILGFKKPEGLQSFVDYIKTEKPDIVHFHEIGGSNGITIHHLKEVKKIGIKVLFTFHLSHYSCMTGTLMNNGNILCDGKIEIDRCTMCYLKSKKINPFLGYFFSKSSQFLSWMGIDPTVSLNTLGTALGTAALVKKKHRDLLHLVSYCDRVVVLTDWYRDILIRNGVSSNKIIKIPQGLPFSVTSSKLKRKSSDILRFLFVGRISAFKGLHLLIDAFKHLDVNRAELHIYGQTDNIKYEEKLKKQTVSVPNIVWNGVIERSEVLNIMFEYDALCLCSTFSEMSPLVIQEAFAARLPVIASNVYGNAENIEHGVNGLLYDFNDLSDLKTQLIKCINNPSLLQHLKNGIKPPRPFSEVASEYASVYSQLLSERNQVS